ncbi:phosphopantothenate--cysteine ligase : Phosphopantothenoylcysteine synthetase OS=Catellicoccus marimammalium M35/04/3 GN=C683_0479 PE=4 SV=1: DFP [Gemmata massiliana]|uniref:DNA/pantothenate metabolism flavoprotein C-terminal domain-containing protein n=1 Tax=Gemmata massiliana TaxID=1210884 RepID=A0A6P2CXH3_9BACT|nr:phosphopantothenoylcysteine decarboxylase [Gemmata massiliana]VTR93681.1 phosphopantothenate--cysteine ligase : Phosphopantothenoylcysteine synthetase OS=Catellicoccus marimammalium M35/04/3 GN=C683_0479 PE=4 SV=1: DFP [Gemmata massiliana]
MRVLVTAGHTVVPIDAVRVISNGFRGRTGVNIALEARRRGHCVNLLTSDSNAFRPASNEPLLADCWKLERYRTFDDLHDAMRRAIEGNRVDMVIHSAAVSDYRVEGAFVPTTGVQTLAQIDTAGARKIKSNEPELWLRLVQNPKLIDLIRPHWHFSGILVKFKLEVGGDAQQLLEIAELSRVHSTADLVVANTLKGLTFVGLIGGQYVRTSRRELATQLLDAVETLARERAGMRDEFRGERS